MHSAKYSFELFGLAIIGAILISVSSGPVWADDASPRDQKFLAYKSDMPTDLPGVELWHDYGRFALYRATSSALAGVPVDVRRTLVTSDAMDTIRFDAFPFNPLEGEPTIPTTLQLPTVDGASLQVVQFVGPVKQAWLDQLQAAGAEPVHYVESNAYLVWAAEESRAKLDLLVNDGSFLQYSGVYQPYFKLGASLRERVAEEVAAENTPDQDELVTVTIQMLDHVDSKATQLYVAAKAQAVMTPWHSILRYQNTTVQVRAGDLVDLAKRPDIYWIGERLTREMHDEVQGQIMASNFDASQSGPDATGYLMWLLDQGVSTNPADYPVLTVVDDGIGDGTVNSDDPTLHETGSLLNPTRLVFVDNCTNSSSGEGIGGHGHINASIAGGYDTRTGFPFEDVDGYQRGLGINPFARLAGTRVFDPGFDLSSCGGTDTGAILSQQNSGATISTNSWGCSGCAGSYDDGSQAYDVGVRDADLGEPGNQELTVFFSAGNSGPSGGTIGTPGNGKNMITVGASENDRPTWTDGCNVGPSGADDAMDVIDFSSRGPAPGGRLKPEIIAPGTHIQGTASTNNSYNGTSVCDQYEPGGQTVFAASSGTSHSTPAAAGLGTIYHYWLESMYGITPSPALMKCYMIAHPTYLTGVDANDTLPSNRQGYGMPNIAVGLDDTPRYFVNQEVLFDDTGDEWVWMGGVTDPTRPLRVVMAYTDAAGAIGTSPQVNNLHLEVTVNGTTYRGNNYSGQWSIPGGSFDNANNYEAVFLPAGETGALTITVSAANIGGDGVPNVGDGTDQDFALVIYNGSQNPDFTINASPNSQDVCSPVDAQFQVDIGQILDYSDPVNLSVVGEPAGSIASFDVNPVIPIGTSTLTLSTGGVANGTYSFDIVGDSTSGTHSTSVSLTVADAIPGTPILIAPGDAAVDLSLEPEFFWSSASLASSYSIEIAVDSGFANIVYSASGLTGTSHVPTTPLTQSTQYFWRVHAGNACGQSTSVTRSFITANIACIQFTSTDVPVPISSSGTPTVTSDVVVEGIDFITDVNVLMLSGDHTWINDLDFRLVSPEGTSVLIMERDCGSVNNFDINFDDDGVGPAPAWPCPPVDGGTYQPSEPLAGFLDENANGTWTLIVEDHVSSDGGSLNSWTLEICGSAVAECTVDADCDNGQFCDGVETCDPELGCLAGVPVTCDDGISCTSDFCNEIFNICLNSPLNSLCDDGLYCNGAETCDEVLDCQPGTPVVCDDGVECTVDECDEDADSCAFVADDLFCGNGTDCDGVEVCDPVLGCQAGEPIDVDDGIACTVDFCDEASGQVVHQPDDAACDDGLFCTGVQVCDAEQGCVSLGDPCPDQLCDESSDVCVDCLVDSDCDDQNACTTNSCVENVCQTVDNTDPCDDGFLCTSDDTCSGGVCQGVDIPDCEKCSVASDCDDGNPCTDNTCPAGVCVYVANTQSCDDGDICTDGDVCSGGVCVSGSPLNCDDGNACTADSCDSVAGCQSDDTTPVGSCCSPLTGDLTDIDDGVDCTADSCNPDGSVDHDDTCTGGEFCDTGLGACSSPVAASLADMGMFELVVTMDGGGTRPYALRLLGDSGDATVDCVSVYVQSDGSTSESRFEQAANAWGDTVFVHGSHVIPNALYELQLEGIDPPASSFAMTWSWGDVNGNGAVNLGDAQLCVLGFQGTFEVPLEQMDLSPCGGDGNINFGDIQAAVLAFQGATYVSFGCPVPCTIN
ncbi:MAG: S8 family serine peptidase [Phycisphaerae bacterium]